MATAEGWQCVENEGLDPATQRSGQVARRTTPPDEVPDLLEELQRDALAPVESTATPPTQPPPANIARRRTTLEPIVLDRPGGVAPAAQAQESLNPVERSPATPSPGVSDLPLYRALAYRPERAVRLVDLPAEYFAVQLLASSSKENLERFASSAKIDGLAAARIASSGRLLYILMLGIYPDRDSAERAAAAVPERIRGEVVPWVRSLGSLQSAMLAGDELAGTSDI